LVRGMTFGTRAELEADAEQSVRIVTAGGRVHLPSRVGPPTTAVQGFDPEYHEKATIGGLTGIFTPSEIGKIYEANWRRDFSQGSPLIAQIVLVWKELRDKAAVTGRPDSGLQLQLLKLVSHPLKDFVGESYGGYQSWEHMDNPGAAAAAEADQRWGGGAASHEIAGYIRDSRASIKEKLASAIVSARASRDAADPESGRTRADAWAKGTPPANYDMWHPYEGRTLPPQGYGAAKNVGDPQHSSSIVANEVEAIAAHEPGHLSGPNAATTGFDSDPAIADNLGRASHLIEDFFAHSNFVELALALQVGGRPIPPESLKTGTFETPDKMHSLAGKLRDAAAEIRTHTNFIPLVGDAVISALEDVANAAESASKGLGPAPGSHTNLAKDSPHALDFPMAHLLATAADQMVFFQVHLIMQEAPPEKAKSDINILFQLVDSIITVPSDQHPLKNYFSGGGGTAAPKR